MSLSLDKVPPSKHNMSLRRSPQYVLTWYALTESEAGPSKLAG